MAPSTPAKGEPWQPQAAGTFGFFATLGAPPRPELWVRAAISDMLRRVRR
jgi:hypothetical protein